MGRANCVVALLEGRLFNRRAAPLDALGLAKRHRAVRDWDDVLTFFGELLAGVTPDGPWRQRLLAGLGPKATLTPQGVRALVALIATSREVQLG